MRNDDPKLAGGSPRRLRARFLFAMGLPAASAALTCVHREFDPKHVRQVPAEALLRVEVAFNMWTVDYSGGTYPFTGRWDDDYPNPERCGIEGEPGKKGNLCMTGPAAGATGAASPPYQSCPMSVQVPPAAISGGARASAPGSPVTAWFTREWTAHERKARHPQACCYHFDTTPCDTPGEGRPLRDEHDAMVLAPVVCSKGSSWASGPHEPDVEDLDRAERWARAAQAEHASIASFARFSLELLALGAPAELVSRAHHAALEEIEHAKLAFALASKFGLKNAGPGPLPLVGRSATVTPEEVAKSTLLDGCVAETFAAVRARERMPDAVCAQEREALERIAKEEEGHAELAFATLAWLVSAYGEEVRPVLERELDRLCSTMTPSRDVPSPLLQSIEQTIVAPCIRELLEHAHSITANVSAVSSADPGALSSIANSPVPLEG